MLTPSATLFTTRFTRNNMSGDHYEMISKVAFGVSKPGGGCTGCMGVNIACTPRWFKERGVFWSQPPTPHPTPTPPQRAKRGIGVKDCTWAPPILRTTSGFSPAVGWFLLPPRVLFSSCMIRNTFASWIPPPLQPPPPGRLSLHCFARPYLLWWFVLPIFRTHFLALLAHYFKSVACVYSVIFSLQRQCTRCRVTWCTCVGHCCGAFTKWATVLPHSVHTPWWGHSSGSSGCSTLKAQGCGGCITQV